MPEILGSGHNLVDMVAEGNMMLKGILFLFVMKLFFSCVSFGSGAPGGIFFPLLVLGSLIEALMPLCSHISWDGFTVYQQFYCTGNGWLFYSNCTSTDYRNHSDF